MILNMSKQLAAVKAAIESGDDMGAAIELASIYSAGMAMERERVITIIQQHGMNPLPLIEKIRRPIR